MGKAANKSTCPGTKEQAPKRDARGRWKPGQSGNPSGAKPGNSARVLLMARSWAEEKGLPLLIAAAEDGDMDAVRLLVQLGMPRTKAISLPQEMPSDPAGLLSAMAAGEVDPDTAKTAMDIHLTKARIIEIEELEKRLAALEALQEKETRK